MRAALTLLKALAALMEQFVDANGVGLLVDLWRQRMSESAAKQRLAEEQAVASALARGDLAAIESNAERLLSEARQANDRRRETGDQRGPGSRDGDGQPEPLGRDDASAESLQREIDQLIS